MKQRIFLVSIGTSLLVGVPLGTLVFGLLTGRPLLALGSDIAGVPVLVYAFISGGPIAVAAGFFGGIVLLALLRSKRWGPGWPGWVLTCAGAGAFTAVGLGLALPFSDSRGEGRLVPVIAFLGTTGASCGGLLGLYGWNVKRRSRSELPG
jgi:hypothetical protein